MNFSFFRKKRINFYSLLLDQAKKAEEGMKALVVYMKDPHALHGESVLRIEEEADDLRRIIVQELNRAFVTPIDREDIFALSRSVDDIIDYAKSTVTEMMAFGVKPNKHMVIMAQALEEGTGAIVTAIAQIPKNQEQAMESVVFAKKRENYIEHCYREALVELFKEKNVVTILKFREIYRHLSNAADRTDESANIIGNILVKTT